MNETTLKVSFELSVQDVRYFRERLKRTRVKRDEHDEASMIESARQLVHEAIEAESPEFVQIRIHSLETLIDMVCDSEWRLEGRDRARVLDALAYFADPEDLIPDRIPGIGFLDDAIMVELVTRELRHEIKAYQDFCEFRTRPTEPDTDRIEARRQGLQRRMRRRRRSELGNLRSGSQRSSFRLW